jgi:hypothetical protein
MVTKKQNIYITGKPSLLALLFLLSPYIYIGGGAKLIIYHVPPLDATRFQKCTPRHFLFEEKDGTLFLILKNILNRAKKIETIGRHSKPCLQAVPLPHASSP